MIDHIVVMAASPSHHMEALTRTRPKAMLPLLGRPIIARIMDEYYQAGIRRFTVVVGEKEGSVVSWLTQKWYPDAVLQFAPQGHQRGTASALFAVRHLVNEPFIITACEHLLPAAYIEQLIVYFDHYSVDKAVLSLFHAPEAVKESAGVLLNPRGQVIFISEKPITAHQDYMTALPVYGLTPHIFEYLDRVPVEVQSGQRIITAAIQTMIDEGGQVGALEASERFCLETPGDLLQMNVQLLEKQEGNALLSDIPAETQINPPVWVDSGVTVGAGVLLGPRVYLEKGTTVGKGANIQDSVVLGRYIGPEQKISNELVIKDRR